VRNPKGPRHFTLPACPGQASRCGRLPEYGTVTLRNTAARSFSKAKIPPSAKESPKRFGAGRNRSLWRKQADIGNKAGLGENPDQLVKS